MQLLQELQIGQVNYFLKIHIVLQPNIFSSALQGILISLFDFEDGKLIYPFVGNSSPNISRHNKSAWFGLPKVSAFLASVALL